MEIITTTNYIIWNVFRDKTYNIVMNPITFEEIEYLPIPDYDKYYISRCGNVLSFKCKKPKILAFYINKKNGYKVFCVYQDNKKKTKPLHRLLAMTFFPDFSSELEVDHKDNNKLNNDLSNLHMVTASGNRRNQLCHSGVDLSYDKRRGHYTYRARWHDDTGVQRFKTFSCQLYGFGDALRLAQEKREEMVDMYYNRPECV